MNNFAMKIAVCFLVKTSWIFVGSVVEFPYLTLKNPPLLVTFKHLSKVVVLIKTPTYQHCSRDYVLLNHLECS